MISFLEKKLRKFFIFSPQHYFYCNDFVCEYLILQYAVSTQRCYLVILDAQRIGEKNEVVARLEVPRHLNFPLGFHGFWAPNNSGLGNLQKIGSRFQDSWSMMEDKMVKLGQ